MDITTIYNNKQEIIYYIYFLGGTPTYFYDVLNDSVVYF